MLFYQTFNFLRCKVKYVRSTMFRITLPWYYLLRTCKNYGEGMNTKSEGEFSFCYLVSIMDEIRAGLSQSSGSLMGHSLFL